MARFRESRVRDDVIKGAIAGAVATWVMGKVTTVMYEREDRWVRRAEDDVRGARTSYGVAAEKAARLAGASLNKDQSERPAWPSTGRSGSGPAPCTRCFAGASRRWAVRRD